MSFSGMMERNEFDFHSAVWPHEQVHRGNDRGGPDWRHGFGIGRRTTEEDGEMSGDGGWRSLVGMNDYGQQQQQADTDSLKQTILKLLAEETPPPDQPTQSRTYGRPPPPVVSNPNCYGRPPPGPLPRDPSFYSRSGEMAMEVEDPRRGWNGGGQLTPWNLNDYFHEKPIEVEEEDAGARERRRAALLDAPPMQSSFSRHLLGSFGEIRPPEPIQLRLNESHPAYHRPIPPSEPEPTFEPLEGPEQFPYYYVHSDMLKFFDIAYEQSIWDYDPKFTWDYLPLTRRGSKPLPMPFLLRVDYTEDENKWRKWEAMTEKIWRTQFVPKVLEQQRCMEMGLEPPSLNPESEPKDHAPIRVYEYFESEIGFSEEMCTVEYCGVCEMTFNSVLPSVMHYFTERHEARARDYFTDQLWEAKQITEEDIEKKWFEDLVNRFLKTYKIRPRVWHCTLCNVELSSAPMAKIHFKGSQHQRRANGLPAVEKLTPTVKKMYELFCVLCGLEFANQVEAQNHIHTRRHVEAVKACGQSGKSLPPGPSSQIGRSKTVKQMLKKLEAAPSYPAVQNSYFATGGNLTPLGSRFPAPPPLPSYELTQDQDRFFCAICCKEFSMKMQYDIHLAGAAHLKREADATKRALKGKQPVPANQAPKPGSGKALLEPGASIPSRYRPPPPPLPPPLPMPFPPPLPPMPFPQYPTSTIAQALSHRWVSGGQMSLQNGPALHIPPPPQTSANGYQAVWMDIE